MDCSPPGLRTPFGAGDVHRQLGQRVAAKAPDRRRAVDFGAQQEYYAGICRDFNANDGEASGRPSEIGARRVASIANGEDFQTGAAGRRQGVLSPKRLSR